jgi:hypothetical protein
LPSIIDYNPAEIIAASLTTPWVDD